LEPEQESARRSGTPLPLALGLRHAYAKNGGRVRVAVATRPSEAPGTARESELVPGTTHSSACRFGVGLRKFPRGLASITGAGCVVAIFVCV